MKVPTLWHFLYCICYRLIRSPAVSDEERIGLIAPRYGKAYIILEESLYLGYKIIKKVLKPANPVA